MRLSKQFAVFGCCMLGFSYAVAGTMGPIDTAPPYRLVVAVLGGYASINAGGDRTYIGADADKFIYVNNDNNRSTGFVGGFLGVERALPFYRLSAQVGAEYDYFGRITTQGLHTVGNDPAASTLYQYSYQFQTQQVMAVGKLFTTVYEQFHPYFSAGIGAAFNNSSNFNAVTQQTGTINLAPSFNNRTYTSFAYSLGAGIDTNLSHNMRVGLGYRYSNFGQAQFSNGFVPFNNQVFPVPFALTSSNLYAQQFIAQVSYLV